MLNERLEQAFSAALDARPLDLIASARSIIDATKAAAASRQQRMDDEGAGAFFAAVRFRGKGLGRRKRRAHVRLIDL